MPPIRRSATSPAASRSRPARRPAGKRGSWKVHEDLFGHGTACAGIIRRQAPDAQLFSVRVLGKSLKGTGTALIAGIRWALEQDMDVINLSLSTRRREHYAALHDPADVLYNPSPPVEFGAAGIAVEVPWQGGGTITTSGNSYAAAHVWGLLARILGKHTDLTPFQLKTVLHAICTDTAP